jgi:hydrogenase maturation protein HypF
MPTRTLLDPGRTCSGRAFEIPPFRCSTITPTLRPCAEHGIDEPVLGLAADGVGWAPTACPGAGAPARAGGGIPAPGASVPLPGGDRAAREPWRMACGVLHALGRREEAIERFAARPNVEQVLGMLLRGARCPPTTSLGRWFDAAAGLLGICEDMSFEGQAAMLLKFCASFWCLSAPARGYYIDTGPRVACLCSISILARAACR